MQYLWPFNITTYPPIKSCINSVKDCVIKCVLYVGLYRRNSLKIEL